MLCPNCHGQRFVPGPRGLVPCPECGGHGEIHCCDGLQEQPPVAAPSPEPGEDRENGGR